MNTELTRYTNVQLTITWDTKQTMGQYDEIRENEPFDESEFFEYLVNNFVEWVRNSTDKEIRRELVIMND